MRILIVGAGSIGVYLGTLLSVKGNDVFLLGRSKLKKLHDTILIGNTPYKLPKRIYSFPKKGSYDFVFITSKLYDLQKNLKLLIKKNVKSEYLVSIQNGLVDEDIYKPYLGNSKFTTISIFEGFRLVENQLIVSHSKTGWKTEDSNIGKKVSLLLLESGIKCSVDSNLDSAKAEKMIMNCCVNLLSAIEKKTFYELVRNTKTKNKIEGLFDETYLVLSKIVKMRSRKDLKKLFYETVSPMRHYSSTYQDAISGRKTEIDFLNGYIVKLGKKYNLSVAENKKLISEFQDKFNSK